MNKIKAKDLGMDSIMVDTNQVVPVIRTQDVQHKQPIYLASRILLKSCGEEDIIPLGYATTINGQIRSIEEKRLITVEGLKEIIKNLTVIE